MIRSSNNMSSNNNNNFFCYTIRIFNNKIIISIFSVLLLFFLFCIHNVAIYGQKSDFAQLVTDDDGVKEYENINIIAVGDFYCNNETEDTIKNIISIDPKLIITTGDHVKDEKSAKCLIEMSEPIKDKIKIAIGNHDRDSSKIYKQITKNHNLTSLYY